MVILSVVAIVVFLLKKKSEKTVIIDLPDGETKPPDAIPTPVNNGELQVIEVEGKG